MPKRRFEPKIRLTNIKTGHRIFGYEFDGPPVVGQRYGLQHGNNSWDVEFIPVVKTYEGNMIVTKDGSYERTIES